MFYNGLHLEGRLADVLEKFAERKPTYAVTDNSPKLAPAASRTGIPRQLRPARFVRRRAVGGLTRSPRENWPKSIRGRAGYERRAAAFAQLRALDDETRRRLAEIPAEQRVLVTAHDAFGYFGRAYDVEVHGLQGISTADEADLGAINALVRMLVGVM